MVDLKLGITPFKEGAKFLRGKEPTPSKSYTDLLHEAHDKAFVIAGVAKVNLLSDVQELLAKAMESGKPSEQWKKDFIKTIEGRWLPTTVTGEPNTGWRARVIYETNMKTAYAAERHKQLQRLKKLKPFWRYRIGNSKKHRPEHVSWNGLVLSADDPWWKTHFPPNGWGCNCYIEALDEIDMRELGKSAPDEAPPDNPRRVQYGDRMIEVPQGIDPGWAYTPGTNVMQGEMRSLAQADPKIAVASWDDIKKYAIEPLNTDHNEWVKQKLKELEESTDPIWDTPLPVSEPILSPDDFKQWAKPLIDSRRGFNDDDIPAEYRIVGLMNTTMLEGLEKYGIDPGSAGLGLGVTDIDPGHTIRPYKRARGAAIEREDLYDLPKLLADESLQRAILLDIRKDTPELLIVFDAKGQTYNQKHPSLTLKGKFVVLVGVEVEFKKNGRIFRRILNRVRTGGLVPYHNLANENDYKRLKWTYKAK